MIKITIEYGNGDKYVAAVPTDAIDEALLTVFDDLRCVYGKEMKYE